MILYLDTSALVKRYIKESYTEDIIVRWLEAEDVVTSSVAYAEALATLYRKKRETEFEDNIMQQLLSEFRRDWISFIRIRVGDELNEYIDKVIHSHPLRGFDAIHLASAMVVHEKFQADLLFACFDQKLSHAAQKEGLHAFPAV